MGHQEHLLYHGEITEAESKVTLEIIFLCLIFEQINKINFWKDGLKRNEQKPITIT